MNVNVASKIPTKYVFHVYIRGTITVFGAAILYAPGGRLYHHQLVGKCSYHSSVTLVDTRQISTQWSLGRDRATSNKKSPGKSTLHRRPQQSIE